MSSSSSETSPVVTRDRVSWVFRWPCDVKIFPAYGPSGYPPHTGVYVYDLRSGEVQKFTDHVESEAMIDSDLLLIVESCEWVRRVYGIHLMAQGR